MKTILFLLLFSVPLLAINIGQTAPEFTLNQYNGGSVSLSDYQGKVVYIFFLGWG